MNSIAPRAFFPLACALMMVMQGNAAVVRSATTFDPVRPCTGQVIRNHQGSVPQRS